ncbi:MAG: class I SAM-dependent methyltransferase [Lachnospiraceae bacterium]|jgi:16S rRNA (guanine1207-N2)-methyltransferase|nr:class I SAM-dependent methyltransferase [Lachnospiraceae bacterium]
MTQHYYSKEPVSASHIRHIEYEIAYQGRPLQFHFETDSGVFSTSRVDHGTDILLRAIAKEWQDLKEPPKHVLDIGCGYGPIGITLGHFFPAASVCMLDVNERAMALARANAQKAGLAQFTVDTVEHFPQQAFDLIVTNPPIRAGKAVVYGIFAKAQEHLAPGGAFYAVIRKNQGGPSAVKELTRLFGECQIIERQSGFHILKCIK